VTNLSGRTVVVGVTGGIAAYKSCEIVSSLVKMGVNVRVVMTQNATHFVAPLTFETLSNNRVVADMFDRDFEYDVAHISLAKAADLLIIAPCTANFVGKFAGGIADDFLTTFAMAATCPVLLAPAMNTAMYESASYKDNETKLRARGVMLVDPIKGRLACGDSGSGKMAEPQAIIASAVSILSHNKDYAGKTVLITAGATREPIDPVRFVSNYSSGKMGIALAKAASLRGAKVILIHGNVNVPIDPSWTSVAVRSTEDMYREVTALYKDADIIIKAAAPCDYRIDKVSDQKIKAHSLTVSLTKNPDIAAFVGANKGKRKLVVFCAESENLLDNAKRKLLDKNADWVIANDITQEGAGFDVDTNIATLISRDKQTQLDIMTKEQLAHKILDAVK